MIRTFFKNLLSLFSNLFLAFFLIATILFLGCGQDPEAEATSKAEAETTAHHGAKPTVLVTKNDHNIEDSPTASADGEIPEFLPLGRLPYEELEIPVMDSLKLYGRLYDPSQKPESEDEDEDEDEEEAEPTEKYPLIILLHALNGNHRDWAELPARLVNQGYAVLLVDQRGHGKSALKGQSWRSFKDSQWKRLSDDTLRMISFFQDSEDYPQVDNSRVGVIGASIGANVALIAGARDNATDNKIKALITLSTGMKYKGLETTKPIYRYKSPLMMIASQNDKYAFESTQMLNRLHTGVKSIKLYKNIGHGTDMIRFFPELQKEIVQWLVTVLPPTPATIIYPDDEEDEDAEEEGEESH